MFKSMNTDIFADACIELATKVSLPMRFEDGGCSRLRCIVGRVVIFDGRVRHPLLVVLCCGLLDWSNLKNQKGNAPMNWNPTSVKQREEQANQNPKKKSQRAVFLNVC